jgi:hypothetical protein
MMTNQFMMTMMMTTMTTKKQNHYTLYCQPKVWDAFACHLYMLFSVMFFMESKAKIGAGLKRGGRCCENIGEDGTVSI